MKKFGLIGYPLSHSFSQQFFTEKFDKEQISDCMYQLFPIESIQDLGAILKQEKNELKGLNVTIPYKVSVLEYLNQITEEAQQIGAVNCIKISENQKLIGYNTDVDGFRKSLKPLLQEHHQKALILGNGGASKAVKFALNQLGIQYQIISRISQENYITYPEIDKNMMENHLIIINTTPLGMFPYTENAPEIPYEFLSPRHLVYDLVYNPEKTLFLSKAEAKGAVLKNGLEMLHLQALRAWEIWNQ